MLRAVLSLRGPPPHSDPLKEPPSPRCAPCSYAFVRAAETDDTSSQPPAKTPVSREQRGVARIAAPTHAFAACGLRPSALARRHGVLHSSRDANLSAARRKTRFARRAGSHT